MKSKFLILGLLLLSIVSFSQQQMSDEDNLRRIADFILEENARGFVDNETGELYPSVKGLKPNKSLKLNSPHTKFYYAEGVLNIAMLELGKSLNEQKYIDYTVNNIEFIYDNAYYFEGLLSLEEDNHWYLPFASLFVINYLDDCGAMGASIIDAYQVNKNKEYMAYIEKTADFIGTKQFRLDDGTLVRNRPVEYSLWADDLYMSVPFLARMGELTGEIKYFDDAAKQVINFTHYLWDEQFRIYFHNWHSDENAPGVSHWGRANGWIMMAQVELLKRLPDNHPKRAELIEILKQQIRGVARYQSASGLWHQLLDKVDSYEETSGTAMFTYGIAWAVNEGIMPDRYISVAQRGWEGLMSKTDKDYRSGAINDICIGTGIQGNLVHYYKRPTRANEVGVGAVISAGVEIVKYNKTHSINE